MQKLRNFVFTINNWTQEDLDKLMTLPIKYLVYGREVGDEGTPHLQGYVELDRRTSFAKVKETIPRAHVEARKGTQQEAIAYCKKDDDWEESGERRIQGERLDIKKITESIQKGGGIRTILELEEITLNVFTIRTAEKLLQYYEPRRDYKPHVVWIYGPTGTGKTRASIKALPDAYFFSNSTGRWWSGYDGHEDVIIDDIRRDTISFVQLLGLTDRYGHHIEDKGSIRQFRGRRIIITSPGDPKEIYNHGEFVEDITQLTRRIDAIHHFVSENSDEEYNTFEDLLGII
uniref:Replication-associated protein n=1 Tax=Rhinopithecus-associated circovirus 1 TaxID=3071097 RepID=A0AA51GGR8_9CIRC|nr:replication-associated protein [Rhinopithecus-associated circovirus 1]